MICYLLPDLYSAGEGEQMPKIFNKDTIDPETLSDGA